METRGEVDPLLSREALQARVTDYTSGQDAGLDLISPVFADLSGLPPLLIQAGSHEVLLDDALRLARRPPSPTSRSRSTSPLECLTSSRPIPPSSTKRPRRWTEPDGSCPRDSPVRNASLKGYPDRGWRYRLDGSGTGYGRSRGRQPHGGRTRGSEGTGVPPEGGSRSRATDRRAARLPPTGVARRAPSDGRVQHARLPGGRPAVVGQGDADDPLPDRGPLRRADPISGRAPCGGPARAPGERSLDPEGRDAPRACRALRRRALERRGAVSHDGRGGRGSAHRGSGDRAVDRARLPPGRPRPSRRLPPRRRRAPTRDQRTYGIDHLPSEDELLEIADRWRPYRSLA